MKIVSPLNSRTRRDREVNMKWITRKDIKVDRVACPWLIKRFVDPQAEFLFVEEKDLVEQAKKQDAIPFDALSATHSGPTFISRRADRAIAEPYITATERTTVHNGQTRSAQ
jgi:hypothetical protein